MAWGLSKMAKRDYFLIVDTETTQDSMVADFGALVVDRKGKIYKECAVLINGIYTDTATHPLFFTSDANGIWSKNGQDKRYTTYTKMLEGGTRMLASVGAVNRWLDKVKAEYNPYLTAYNLAFDQDKCAKTGIDIAQFDKRFCLWHAAFNKWAHTKAYRNFALHVHAFNAPTDLGNMSFKTNAETMARFVLNNPTLEDEPHTALEDAKFYELPILTKLVNSTKKEKYINPAAFDWKKVQVRDWFTAK
jgi:hypothetical protein